MRIPGYFSVREFIIDRCTFILYYFLFNGTKDNLLKKIYLLSLLIISVNLFALEKSFILDIAYTHNNLGIPFLNSPIGTGVYPGVRVGTDFYISDNEIFDFLLNLNASISFHEHSAYGNVFKLGPKIVARVDLDFGLYFDGLFGLSYTHIFSTIPTYTVSDTNIEQKPDWGRPNLAADLGLRIGYRFNRKTIPIRVYLGADCELIYAFTDGFGLPVT